MLSRPGQGGMRPLPVVHGKQRPGVSDLKRRAERIVETLIRARIVEAEIGRNRQLAQLLGSGEKDCLPSTRRADAIRTGAQDQRRASVGLADRVPVGYRVHFANGRVVLYSRLKCRLKAIAKRCPPSGAADACRYVDIALTKLPL